MATDNAVMFFYHNAGYGYNPKTETADQGRIRTARELAYYEEVGRDEGLSFSWEIDRDIGSSEFSDDEPAWQLWACLCHDSNGNVVESLWGIDFGRDSEPWGNGYRRVVEAELAMQHLCQVSKQSLSV